MNKKYIAMTIAALMLAVCLVPVIGHGNDAAGGFIDDTYSSAEIPVGYIEVKTVQDLEKVRAAPTDMYFQTADIVFTAADDIAGGVPLILSAAASNGSITVRFTADGHAVSGAKVWFNGGSAQTGAGGEAVFTGYTAGTSYIISASHATDGYAAALHLAADETSGEIKMNSKGNFTPIGGFGGIYNGNGYKIVGMHVTGAEAGMFIAADGEVSNLGLENGAFTAYSNSDAMAGSVAVSGNMTIYNCYGTGVVSAISETGAAGAGGIVGDASGTVTSCFGSGGVFAAGVTGADAGGIAGMSQNDIIRSYNSGTVEACGEAVVRAGGVTAILNTGDMYGNHNTGRVSANSASLSYAGGIVGSAGADIMSSYNMGSVSSSSANDSDAYAGGIAGFAGASIKIFNCYGTGSVRSSSSGEGVSYAGGIAGAADIVYNCFGTGDVTATGTNKIGGIAGTISAGGYLVNCYFLAKSSLKLYGEGPTDTFYIDGEDVNAEDTEDAEPVRDPNLGKASGGYSKSEMNRMDMFYSGVTAWDDGNMTVNGWYDDTISYPRWVKQSQDQIGSVNSGYPYLDGMDPSGYTRITERPVSQYSAVGGEVTFTVRAQSDLPLKYQWRTNPNSTGDSGWTNISGATDNSYTVSNVASLTYNNRYECVVTNDAGFSGTAGPVQILKYDYEIKTIEDLKNVSANPSGSFVQTADLRFEDKDLNGGHEVTVVSETKDGSISFTVTYDDGKAAGGVHVVYNETYGTTDTRGIVSFAYAENGSKTVAAGGIISTADAFAMTFEIGQNGNTAVTENSNGNFDPLGKFDEPFSGIYNGNGFKIYGLETAVYSERPENAAASGLFGYVTGTIKNVSIEDGNSVALASNADGDTNAYAGSIAGSMEGGTISSSYSKASVTAAAANGSNAYAGGIAGSTAGSTVSNCYTIGERIVLGASANVFRGGITGSSAGTDIVSCYFLDAGGDGLAGDGTVTADGGTSRTDGTQSGAKSADALKNKSTYFSSETAVGGETIAGWDFDGTWLIGSDGYPQLRAVSGPSGGDGTDPLMIAAAIAIAAVVIAGAVLFVRRRRA